MRLIEPDDLGQDAERRIVHDNAAIRIRRAFVIRARPEWANNLDIIRDIIFGAYPCEHRIIYFRRRITIVGGLLRFEFVDEFFI